MGNQFSSSGCTRKLVLAGTVIAAVAHAWKTGNLLLAGIGIAVVALAWKFGFLKCSKTETKDVNRRMNDSPQEAELSFVKICGLFVIFAGLLLLVGLMLISLESNDEQLTDSQLPPNQSDRIPILVDDQPPVYDDDLLDEVCDSGSSLQREIKIMTYNLCQSEKEDSLYARMAAVTLLVQKHMPDVILFQEATPRIREFLASFYPVWHLYLAHSNCVVLSKLPMKFLESVPFTEGGELLLTKTDFCNGKDLFIATTHLKRNSKAARKEWKKRMSRAKEAIETLNHYQNIILGGDMNWRTTDAHFPLEPGWIDAWESIKPEQPGYTFDTETNPLLKGRNMSRQRFDRFFCKLNNFEVTDIEIIGKEEISVALPCKSTTTSDYKSVIISEHYGLILTVCAI